MFRTKGQDYFWRFVVCTLASALCPAALAVPRAVSLAATIGGVTLVQRETFQGVGTLNSASPGSLGAVTGNFYKRAGGPRVTNDTTTASYGWSGDFHETYNVFHTISDTTTFPSSATYNTGGNTRCLDFWINVDRYTPSGTNAVYLCVLAGGSNTFNLSLGTTAGAPTLTYTMTASAGPGGTSTTTTTAIPLDAWRNIRVAWQQRATSVSGAGAYYEWDVSVLVRAPGGAWTEVATYTDYRFGNLLSSVAGGSKSFGASLLNGRYGMPSVYSLNTWADRTALVADVVDPAAGPRTWFLNAATGSDTNDGATASSAWASAAKFNAESQYCGLFPTTAGYASGDTLTIDTSTANLALGVDALAIQTRGLNVVQVGGGEIQAWKPIANRSFSLVSGATKTYQHTLTESAFSIVPWENDRWLNHVTAASFTGSATANYVSYANVTAALEALPGSFWTDGTTLYLHPFGDTNPTTDGKVYTRSVNRVLNGISGTGVGGGNGAGSAVQLLAADLHLNGLIVRKTCLADMATSDPILAYSFHTNLVSIGYALVENCQGIYGSKHIFGFTDNSTTRNILMRDCVAEQGSPYAGAGGQTPLVDYSSLTGPLTNQTTYLRVTSLHSTGLIGSTVGQNPSYIGTWISHGGSGSGQFSSVSFLDCNFGTAGGGGSSSATSVAHITSTGTTWSGGFNVGTAVASFDRCTFTLPVFASAGGSASVTNSIFACVGTFASGQSFLQAAGSVSYIGCTVNMTGVTNSDGATTSFLYRVGALNLTWRNNILLTSDSNTVVGNATGGDTLTFDHNAYTGGGYVARGYNDGTITADRTLVQWQALGQDIGSLVATHLGVLADGSLSASSPAIDLGQNVGPAADYTGVLFAVRNDAGAFEYPLPALRTAPSAAQATEGANVTLTVQVAGNGPFTYQWQRNGLPVADGTGSSLTLPGVLPGQSGEYSVIVTNAHGSIRAGPAAVEVVPVTFAVWQTDHFTSTQLADASVSGPLADPDGDGRCNLLEYAFGSDPGLADGTAAGVDPAVKWVSSDDGNHLAITYRRLINTTALAYVVGVSSDLVSWDESQTQTAVVGTPQPTGDGHTELVTVQLTSPTAAESTPRQFMRVKIVDD